MVFPLLIPLISGALSLIGHIGGGAAGAAGRVEAAKIAAEGKLRAIEVERADRSQELPRRAVQRPKSRKKKRR